jgi:isocitrate/isopropylmalate dehydrogenase
MFIDLFREQTEGEYSNLEHESVPGVVECLKVTTREKCERIAKFAFDFATKHNRKRVTCVHKVGLTFKDHFYFFVLGQHHEAWGWSVLEDLRGDVEALSKDRI